MKFWLIRKVGGKVYNLFRLFRNKVFEFLNNLKYYIYNYHITNFPVYLVRKWYLKSFLGVVIEKNAFIHMGCFFSGNDIKIGEDTVIGRDCVIVGEVEIGKHCSISAYTIIQSVTHDKNSNIFIGVHKKIFIRDYVWIGFRSTILLGVIIEKGCIIGANSLVNKKIELPYEIWAGCPAHKVGIRDENACCYELKYHPVFN